MADSSFDLSGWRNSSAVALTGKLPLQTYESSQLLVETYLANNGGWIPDNPANPTGPGVPVTGETPDEAADSITAQQYDKIYNMKIIADISVSFNYLTNMTTGQSVEAVLTSLQTSLDDFLQSQLTTTDLSLVSLNSTTGTTTLGGFLTAAQRVSIYNDLVDGKSTDPQALALKSARDIFTLPATWNVESSYTEVGNKIVITLRKYTTIQFDTIDPNVTQKYVMTMNPDHYTLESGLYINQES